MIVYFTINLINGKMYVGQTPGDDDNYLGGGFLIKKAIETYGREKFKRITLRKCSSQEELDKQEVFWITILNTLSPNGYNLELGGKSGSKISMSIKQKMRDAKLGVKGV